MKVVLKSLLIRMTLRMTKLSAAYSIIVVGATLSRD